MGSKVNGQACTRKVLKPGDQIEMGRTVLIFYATPK
jgi:hypothetical protein